MGACVSIVRKRSKNTPTTNIIPTRKETRLVPSASSISKSCSSVPAPHHLPIHREDRFRFQPTDTPTMRSSGSSKDEKTTFDPQLGVESGAEDDFFSVNVDFPPSEESCSPDNESSFNNTGNGTAKDTRVVSVINRRRSSKSNCKEINVGINDQLKQVDNGGHSPTLTPNPSYKLERDVKLVKLLQDSFWINQAKFHNATRAPRGG